MTANPEMEEPAKDVLRFIADRIDTVPELEALLLFFGQRPTALTVQQLADRLFVSRGLAAVVVGALERRRFIMPMATGLGYAYDSAWDSDGKFMTRVAATYRLHLIRVTKLIHSKAPTPVLEFARAFEPKRDR
jgi:hypothetical protein